MTYKTIIANSIDNLLQFNPGDNVNIEYDDGTKEKAKIHKCVGSDTVTSYYSVMLPDGTSKVVDQELLVRIDFNHTEQDKNKWIINNSENELSKIYCNECGTRLVYKRMADYCPQCDKFKNI